MQIQDNMFFEEYKRLDKLCSEMYSCQNGISEYISQMEKSSFRGVYLIHSWNTDYNNLKHVRWVRNQIAHNSDLCQTSEPEDLEFVRDFYNSILSCQDPLTLLRKADIAQNARLKQQKKEQMNHAQNMNILFSTVDEYNELSHKKKASKWWIGVLVGGAVIATIVLLLCFIS